MKNKSIFCIIKQVAPFDKVNNTFMIMETVFTSDGPRSRICDGRYLDHETAIEALKIKEYRNEH
jgi:hypothetical protein